MAGRDFIGAKGSIGVNMQITKSFRGGQFQRMKVSSLLVFGPHIEIDSCKKGGT